ncbi:MAG: M20/M25/M40 family metallo-hydrolase [Kangiellaceae bacterium]
MISKKNISALILLLVIFSSIAFGKQKTSTEKIWISIGHDAVTLIEEKYPSKFSWEIESEVSLSKKENVHTETKVNLVAISSDQVNLLSKLMHDEFNRCGGFVAHQSLQDAKQYVANEGRVIKSKNIEYSITETELVNQLLNQVVADNMSSTVNSLSNYNNRYYAAQTGEDAANWLMNEWADIVSTRSDISVELYQHSAWQQPSVIATIPGTTNADEVVIVGGHLDSINGSSQQTGRAPGSDDNASGIAVVTELLRAIAVADYQPSRTIKIMGYAAEEVGLRGSDDIAQQHLTDNINVVGVAQFDMTGFKGDQHRDITLISDFTDNAQNQFMTQLLDTYLPEVTYGFDPCGYACSDHASWNNRNFPASFPFEASFGNHNQRIHTASDDTFDAEHALKFAKLAMVYVIEMAKGQIGDLVISRLQFSSSNLETNDGQTIAIEVERGGDVASEVTIDYTTINGTAIAGTDYTATSGSLTWAAQDSANKTIEVNIGDVSSDKIFTVELSNPQGNSELGVYKSITVEIKAANAPDPIDTVGIESSGGGAINLAFLLFPILAIRLKNCFEKS